MHRDAPRDAPRDAGAGSPGPPAPARCRRAPGDRPRGPRCGGRSAGPGRCCRCGRPRSDDRPGDPRRSPRARRSRRRGTGAGRTRRRRGCGRRRCRRARRRCRPGRARPAPPARRSTGTSTTTRRPWSSASAVQNAARSRTTPAASQVEDRLLRSGIRASRTTASMVRWSCSMWASSRSDCSSSATPSASSRSAVTGVRSRWDRSPTAARSASSSSMIRSASRFRVSASSTVSRGPAGLARASRSPSCSRWATTARSVTGVLSRRPIRSATPSASAVSSRPSSPMLAHARPTPACRLADETEVRTTAAMPWGPSTGTYTTPPGPDRSRKASPAWALRTPGSSARSGAGEPSTVPSASSTEVRAVERASLCWTRRARVSEPRSPETSSATARASCSPADIARSSATVRTSRHSGITKARTTADVVAATSQVIRRLTAPGPRWGRPGAGPRPGR